MNNKRLNSQQIFKEKNQVGQWKRMQSPETDPQNYSQLIFNGETKTIKLIKKSFLSNDPKTGHPYTNKTQSRHRPYNLHKN